LEEVFPREEVAVVEGAGGMIGDKLLALPFDHVFFTGSPRIGARVGEAAARVHAGLTLELGGKSPTIILRGADLDDAAGKILWGKCMKGRPACRIIFSVGESVGAFARPLKSSRVSTAGKSGPQGIWRFCPFRRTAAAVLKGGEDRGGPEGQMELAAFFTRGACMPRLRCSAVRPIWRSWRGDLGPIQPVLPMLNEEVLLSSREAKPPPCTFSEASGSGEVWTRLGTAA
jgi:hypothetical protein